MEINKFKTLCLIPARSGSKRLPKKNKLLFHGLPLYKWSILAASKSKNIALICLSTDDKEIIEKEKNNSNIFLHKRNKLLSNDRASVEDLIDKLLEQFQKNNLHFSHVVLLQPTSPLREEGLIDKCIKICQTEKKTNGLIEINSLKLSTGKIKDKVWFPDNNPDIQSQSVENTYIPSGRVFIYEISIKNKIIRSNHYALLSSNKYQNNIDTEEDFQKTYNLYDLMKSDFDYIFK